MAYYEQPGTTTKFELRYINNEASITKITLHWIQYDDHEWDEEKDPEAVITFSENTIPLKEVRMLALEYMYGMLPPSLPVQ